MKEISKIIIEKKQENIFMKMIVIISVNGKKIQKMEKENYMIKMEKLFMKEFLRMVYIIQEKKRMVKNMEREQIIIQIKIKHMKEILKKEKEGEMENLLRQMELQSSGEWDTGYRHGKGTLYYPNGKIKYEGFFNSDKEEDTKGKLYDKNGKIIYEGDFINGLYYIGEKKGGKKHGKGIEYYTNQKKAYEGDFVNDKREGNGKSFFEDGSIKYSGEWKNGSENGKGILYYQNGKIEVEGYFEEEGYDRGK